MTRLALLGLLLILVAAASGCGDATATAADTGPGTDGDTVAAPDAAPDTAPDAAPDAPFRHTVYTHTEAAGRSGVATGAFEQASVAYGALPVDPKFTNVLNFRMTPFLPPWREPIATHGPLVLFSDDLEVLVFSPLDHFFVSVVELRDGAIHYGLAGEVDGAPADFRHRFLLVEGRGIGATIERWGELLREDRGKASVDRYADVGLSYLGYWTDNGAVYYYHTEDGMNEAETMLALKAHADENGIPLGYLQLDSWWYFKEGMGGLLPSAGLLRWEPQPEMFPDGLEAFQQALGLPLVLHNRWFDADNEYRDQYEFIDDGDMALPTSGDVFDEFMANAERWGAITYEQDWLATQYWGHAWLRDGVDHSATWMAWMDDAAAARGVTMQLCMPHAAHLMDSVDRRASTTTRTSTDYRRELAKEAYWPAFHTVNMLAAALGLQPFKDNFHSGEKHGEAEALVSALSGGMVGVGDGIGQMQREIILRTCRSDGLLLKPDRPATPIDAMFLPHERPYVTRTVSRRDDIGTTTYVAAYHLASAHPQRTAMDKAWAAVSYDGDPIESLFVFPEAVTDWDVELGELGDARDAGERVVVYDWRAGTATVAEGRFALPRTDDLYDFSFVVLAPVQANGLALIGEAAKYVTLADRRFRSVTVEADGFAIGLAGAPGESVEVLAYDTTAEHGAGRLLPPAHATIGPDGTASVTLRR